MMAGMSIDMFIDPDPRSEPPSQGGELETLSGFLRWQRETLELKCSGLDAAGLARRSVEPSSMSLLGLLRHLADVERAWFRSFMAGQDAPSRFSSREDLDGDFDGARPDEAVVAEAWQAWREEIAFGDSSANALMAPSASKALRATVPASAARARAWLREHGASARQGCLVWRFRH
jgi:hypothetical protein